MAFGGAPRRHGWTHLGKLVRLEPRSGLGADFEPISSFQCLNSPFSYYGIPDHVVGDLLHHRGCHPIGLGYCGLQRLQRRGLPLSWGSNPLVFKVSPYRLPFSGSRFLRCLKCIPIDCLSPGARILRSSTYIPIDRPSHGAMQQGPRRPQEAFVPERARAQVFFLVG